MPAQITEHKGFISQHDVRSKHLSHERSESCHAVRSERWTNGHEDCVTVTALTAHLGSDVKVWRGQYDLWKQRYFENWLAESIKANKLFLCNYGLFFLDQSSFGHFFFGIIPLLSIITPSPSLLSYHPSSSVVSRSFLHFVLLLLILSLPSSLQGSIPWSTILLSNRIMDAQPSFLITGGL